MDGKSLTSMAHPLGPLWKRIWMRIFPPDISSSSIEIVEIELPCDECDGIGFTDQPCPKCGGDF